MHGKTKVCGFIAWAFAGAFASMTLSACSSSEGDDENLQSDGNESQANLGEDDAKEGNGQENYVDNDEAKGSKNSADVNSAVGDAAAAPAGGDNALLGNAGSGADPGALAGNAAPAPDAAPLNAPPANAAPANATNAAAPAAPAAATAAAPAPAAAAGTAPVPGGRVRYVKEGGVQVVNAPNGKPVTTLEQGDHPVTWEENGYLRLNSGMYVPVDSMSQTGVARAASGGGWSH